MVPSVYGPLFVLVARAICALTTHLAATLVAFKLLGFATLLACALLCRALGFSRPLLAAIACNPALFDIYVANAHNDLMAADFALGAVVAARRGRPALALVLAAASGTIKATMTLAALCAAAEFRSLRRRVAFAAGAVALAAAAYAIFAGPPFLAALKTTANLHPHAFTGFELGLKLACAATAVFAVLAAVARGRSFPAAGWTFVGLAQYVNPQYLAWALPCVVADEAVLCAYLLSLPLAAYVTAAILNSTALSEAFRGILLVLVAAIVVVRYRPARTAA
jgi:hypothetical protein